MYQRSEYHREEDARRDGDSGGGWRSWFGLGDKNKDRDDDYHYSRTTTIRNDDRDRDYNTSTYVRDAPTRGYGETGYRTSGVTGYNTGYGGNTGYCGDRYTSERQCDYPRGGYGYQTSGDYNRGGQQYGRTTGWNSERDRGYGGGYTGGYSGDRDLQNQTYVRESTRTYGGVGDRDTTSGQYGGRYGQDSYSTSRPYGGGYGEQTSRSYGGPNTSEYTSRNYGPTSYERDYTTRSGPSGYDRDNRGYSYTSSNRW